MGETAPVAEPLARWLGLEPDGTITIRTGKVELGQGVHTALRILVADELDQPLDRVRVAPVNTDASPDEGLTAGSRSMEQAGVAFRRRAASMRATLLAAAGNRLDVPASECRLEPGLVRASAGGAVTLAELAGAGALDAAIVDEAAAPKAPSDRRLTGTSPARDELRPRLLGGETFVQDLRLPGMLHGRVVRPPGPGARLVEVDEPELRDLPGVVDVVRDGSFLAVVAEREDQAVTALRRARRTSQWLAGPILEGAADPRRLRDLPVETSGVVEDREPAAAETAGRADSSAVVRVAAEYSRPAIAHAAMAPSCAVAQLVDSRLTVWCHSQGIFRVRHELAVVLGLEESAIRVLHLPGAGCYGHNGADDVALDAALLARAVPGRPVRVQWMRDDEFAWEPSGPPMLVRIAASVGPDGRIATWDQEAWSPPHEHRPAGEGPLSGPGASSVLLAARHLAEPVPIRRTKPPRGPTSGGQRNAIPGYDLLRRRVVHHHVVDPPLRSSSLRALGAHVNVFAIESMVDELARAADVDPVALRLRHLPDPRARAVIEAVVERAGETDPPAPDVLRGRGVGYARYKNTATYAAVLAEVDLTTEIVVRRVWAAVDAGLVVSLDGLRNQIEGGVVQAIGWTLHEAVTTEGSTISSRGWDTYRPLRFSEVPEIEVVVLDRPDEPPMGAGEAVAGPTSAAIANAVADASGVRLRDLPFTRERVAAAAAAAAAAGDLSESRRA